VSNRSNVLLVILDSVRARNCSHYGYHRETTPFLSELASGGTTFERAISPTVWSLPSHVSMFTGHHATEHGILDQSSKLDPAATVFDELRREHDYDTGIFSQNAYLTAIDTGIRESFEHVTGLQKDLFNEGLQAVAMKTDENIGKNEPVTQSEYIRRSLNHDHPVKSLLNGVYAKLIGWYPRIETLPLVDVGPTDYTAAFEEWLGERDGPWAACINYMGAHTPYRPEDNNYWGDDQLLKIQRETDDIIWEFVGGERPWWQRAAMEHIYDGSIRNLDDELRHLDAALREYEVREDTTVVVCGDHGEMFGEPSDLHPVQLSAHAYSVHERLVHVPLVVDAPGDDGGVVDDPVSLTGLADLIRSAPDGPDVDAVRGPPALTTAPGLELNQKDRASQYVDDLHPYDDVARATYELRDDGVVEKHMTWGEESATVELYDADRYRLVRDGRAADAVDAAFDALGEHDVSAGEGQEVGGIVEQQLKALGYR
jgi:arylsulfatase